MKKNKYTKEFIATKLPELRKLKYYNGKTFPEKKISDEVLINSLYIILNSKGLSDEFVCIDIDDYSLSSFEVDGLIKEDYAKDIIDKIKNMPFDMKKIYKFAEKEAFNVTGIKEELPDSFICTFYHTPDSEIEKIFPGVDSKELYENYSLRGHILGSVSEYISKHRNVKGAKLACSMPKDKLIGKYTVTENNVLSGFMRNSMTLKYVGYLPGKIIETRYGQRHGIDNFWDDHVNSRDFLVLEITNSTGAKEIEKWKEKKYAVDLTKTLQVFDTLEEAVSVANQLNEFHKETLTLNY